MSRFYASLTYNKSNKYCQETSVKRKNRKDFMSASLSSSIFVKLNLIVDGNLHMKSYAHSQITLRCVKSDEVTYKLTVFVVFLVSIHFVF